VNAPDRAANPCIGFDEARDSLSWWPRLRLHRPFG
jgi:hypothetical protein